MRAILLAAGFGTRLRPLTETVPKCLVPINGKPLLGIWLDKLSAEGFGPFLVNTHYLAEKVAQFMSNHTMSALTTLVYEPILLGTAGTFLANADFYQGGDGLIVHADNYCLADLRRLADAHRRRPAGCVMTMLTFHTRAPQTCGIVEIDGRGVVTGFYEKVENPPTNLANAAIYIISAEMIKELMTKMPNATDFSTQVLCKFIRRIYTCPSDASMIDIGTPEAYAEANRWPIRPKYYLS